MFFMSWHKTGLDKSASSPHSYDRLYSSSTVVDKWNWAIEKILSLYSSTINSQLTTISTKQILHAVIPCQNLSCFFLIKQLGSSILKYLRHSWTASLLPVLNNFMNKNNRFEMKSRDCKSALFSWRHSSPYKARETFSWHQFKSDYLW